MGSFDISIHAPPRGATRRIELIRRAAYFNSRPSARGDWATPFWARCKLISIHAPPRGATEPSAVAVHRHLFQFTPLREGRRNHPLLLFTVIYFNSRPSARGDARKSSALRRTKHFNSRPSARGDYTNNVRLPRLLISIHAPPRGATIPRLDGERSTGNFNSRPSARGDSQNSLGKTPATPYFNSRPSARGDFMAFVGDTGILFQFTPLREGRLLLHGANPHAADFNSRPSARGDRQVLR